MNDTGTPDELVSKQLDWSGYNPPISENARKVIEKRYSQKDENGNPIETWQDIVYRVVNFVSNAETTLSKQNEFFDHLRDLMLARKFIPNTPCLVNAGVKNSGLAGCYVLPVPDSIKGIMKAASDAALIHQSGGGTGFSFETLRPAGAIVKSSNGIASGPVSFMRIIDTVTDVVKQGGVRRGANMGIMRVDHPDILQFIDAKTNQHAFLNFNVSVTITDEFMRAVDNHEWIQTKFEGKDWTGVIEDPQAVTGSIRPESMQHGMIYAPMVWQRIVEAAHKYAEPGVIFIDTVNRHNLLRNSMGDIIASNPCCEQFLHPYNSCNLGSIDLAKFYDPRSVDTNPILNFDWDGFSDAIYWSVRFLDNVIDAGNWVLPEIEDVVKRTRPVGLGIMGFADLLLKMKIKYGSEQSMSLLSDLTTMFQYQAWRASCALGKEKGTFPELAYNQVQYDEFLDDMIGLPCDRDGNELYHTPRNYEVTTIAPTGTISLVAETSSGIEPNFDWTTVRRDTVGERIYVHPLANQALDNYDELPEYFVTAHDLTVEQHLRMLAAAQAHIDNGISKTCNAHKDDTVESVDALYRLAYKLGVKSVSYYRDGSRDNQVLTKVESQLETQRCPQCESVLVNKEGCVSCPSCGFAACTIG